LIVDNNTRKSNLGDKVSEDIKTEKSSANFQANLLKNKRAQRNLDNQAPQGLLTSDSNLQHFTIEKDEIKIKNESSFYSRRY
jgi:hypothetical protein